MHELGLVIQIVRQMEAYMKAHHLKKIETLTLSVGQLSEVYPKYLEDVFPLAVKDSLLEDTKLIIDHSPGIGRCTGCDFVYNLVENNNVCPLCDGTEYQVISGTDFLIKEITAY